MVLTAIISVPITKIRQLIAKVRYVFRTLSFINTNLIQKIANRRNSVCLINMFEDNYVKETYNKFLTYMTTKK